MAFDSIITASITIFGGIIVLVVGQIFIRFFIEPLQRQHKVIEEITYSIVFYAHLWANPGRDSLDERGEASDKFRGLAAKLVATTNNIRIFYPSLVDWDLAISYNKVDVAKKNLIGLANSIYLHEHETPSRQADRNLQRTYNIEETLRLRSNIGINMKEIKEAVSQIGQTDEE